METTTESINSAAKNNGLIIGIISSMLHILTYYVSPAMLGSIMFGIVLGLVSLGIYIYFTLDLRKKIGGYWTFKEALRGIFLMSFIAGILTMAINFVFYKFVEPNALGKISGFVMTNLTHTYEKMGMSQDQIDEAMTKASQSLKSQFDPGAMDLLKNLGIGVLFQFIMSLIFAAIFKKNQPIFAPVEE